MRALSLTTTLAWLASSCVTGHYGVGFTARGTLGIERFTGPVTHASYSGGSAAPTSTSSADQPTVQAASVHTNSASNSNNSTEIDVDRGFGGQIALWTPIVDVTTGVQRRKYGVLDTTEGTVGLRWRIYDDEDATPYFFCDLRHTRHESHATEYFNGLALGFGFMFHVSEHVYVDSNLAWERTSGLKLPDGKPRMSEAVFQLGLGVSW